MGFEQVENVPYNENINGRLKLNTVFSEVMKYLPRDLLHKVTILMQGSGYVTIKPVRLTRVDWIRLDRSVRKMGGIWVSNRRFSHWSVPLVHLH